MNINTQTTASKYKHNLNIPGWNGPEFLDVLGKYASMVEENGAILELGALFGRSTYTIGHNKYDSVQLMTIDFWPTMPMHLMVPDGLSIGGSGEEHAALNAAISGEARILSGDSFFELWEQFTDGIPNKTGIRGNVTTIPTDTFPMFDLIFHDAGHRYEDVYPDLTRWLPKLKSNGVILVDDYDQKNWPGVVQAVDQAVKENDLITEMVTHRNILLKRKI